MSPAERGRSGEIWPAWIVANAAGELVGLGATATAAWLAVRSYLPGDPPPPIVLGVALASGLLEGGVVGSFQWRVLRRRLPALPSARWCGATILGATVAWILGLLPSLFMRGAPGGAPTEPAPWLIYLLAAAMGGALGPILALAQWIVLRREARRPTYWIAAHAMAWGLGMPVIFLGIDIALQPGAGASRIVPVLVITFALAGAVVGAVHGWSARRLCPSAR